ncbi:hypothetical protein SHL15_0279 [Streptomyces hygroscopicus subsp. limoneus]|nr:hypothetical protein SHL15_0279 [Streptomyces hygroscopicus subsp. limoneus]
MRLLRTYAGWSCRPSMRRSMLGRTVAFFGRRRTRAGVALAARARA